MDIKAFQHGCGGLTGMISNSRSTSLLVIARRSFLGRENSRYRWRKALHTRGLCNISALPNVLRGMVSPVSYANLRITMKTRDTSSSVNHRWHTHTQTLAHFLHMRPRDWLLRFRRRNGGRLGYNNRPCGRHASCPTVTNNMWRTKT